MFIGCAQTYVAFSWLHTTLALQLTTITALDRAEELILTIDDD